MIGAIIGDIVGSIYEFNNHRSKSFPLFQGRCFFTDDTVMTLSLGKAIKEYVDGQGRVDLLRSAVKYMQEIGRHYPDSGYGGSFYRWIYTDNPKPYNSYGNGAAMRVSAAGFAAYTAEQADRLALTVTSVSHNHPEGVKGAQAVVKAIYHALHGMDKGSIAKLMSEYYDLDFTLDGIRDTYRFNETCQGTVPQAIQAFLESTNFEDAIRNAISIGGDSDTLAAITGSIAEAYYGVPYQLEQKALTYLDDRLKNLYRECKGYNRIIE